MVLISRNSVIFTGLSQTSSGLSCIGCVGQEKRCLTSCEDLPLLLDTYIRWWTSTYIHLSTYIERSSLVPLVEGDAMLPWTCLLRTMHIVQPTVSCVLSDRLYSLSTCLYPMYFCLDLESNSHEYLGSFRWESVCWRWRWLTYGLFTFFVHKVNRMAEDFSGESSKFCSFGQLLAISR